MYAVVDIETTGDAAHKGGITEVAIYLYDGDKIVHKYEQLIHPEKSIPAFITSLTGIDDEMVKDAPVFEEVAGDIYALLKDNIFVAHNVQFDFTHLHHHLKNAGYILNEKKLCTVRLTRKVFPNLTSYSLGNLCRQLNIPIHNRHRAGGDALATVLLLEKNLQAGAEEHIVKMLKRFSFDHRLPNALDQKQIQDLPDEPGVYYFHNARGEVIYVGKAINIRKRVYSHFSGIDKSKKRQDFIRDINRVSYKLCAGELHALIVESAEIKKRWPKHNRSQKKINLQYGAYVIEDNKGLLRLVVQKKLKHLPPVHLFNGLREAFGWLQNISTQHNLDPFLCHLKKSSPEELPSSEEYNSRVLAAIEDVKTTLPTFAVTEYFSNGQCCCMVIVKGVYKGLAIVEKVPEDLEQLLKFLEPGDDNDYIRKKISGYALLNKDRVIHF